MSSYSRGTVVKTYHIEQDYIGPVLNFSNTLLYTVPNNTRAKVFIEFTGSGGIINSHTFNFKQKKVMVNTHTARTISVATPGSANQFINYDDGDKGRYGFLDLKLVDAVSYQLPINNSSPGAVSAWNPGNYTFDMHPGDQLTVDGVFHAGDLNSGERVFYRLRIEEIGPAVTT